MNIKHSFLCVVTEPTRASSRQLLKQQSAATTEEESSINSQRDQVGVMLPTFHLFLM